MNQKEIFDNIMSRTSVRSFLDQPVESEKVEMLLHAAMAAPSACNKQPWHFAVIDDRKLLDQIPHFSPYASMAKEAPLAIVVCGDLNKTLDGTEQEFWIQDCSAATENLLLMANALDLGAVWTALYPLEERYRGNARAVGTAQQLDTAEHHRYRLSQEENGNQGQMGRSEYLAERIQPSAQIISIRI